MAQPTMKPSYAPGTVHESVRTFLDHHRNQTDAGVRKALGLDPSQPLPAGGGEYPKMAYSVEYYAATDEYGREAATKQINSPEDEKTLGKDWFLHPKDAKTAFDAKKKEEPKK